MFDKNPNNNYIRFHKRNISKYSQSIINNSSSSNNKKEITKLYDFVDEDPNDISNKKYLLPDMDDDESTEMSNSYKKEVTFLNKKVKLDNVLHKSLFDNNDYNEKNIIFQSKKNS